jgi:uncharacterized protein YcbX
MDHPQGYVSVMNLASVRSVAQAIGHGHRSAPLPRQFLCRWPEAMGRGRLDRSARKIQLGAADLSLFKPIVRCVATHVNLDTGERDIDMVAQCSARHFGRDTLGTYLSITSGGEIKLGDTLEG